MNDHERIAPYESCHSTDPNHKDEVHNPHEEIEFEQRRINMIRDPDKTYAQLLRELKAYLRLNSTELALRLSTAELNTTKSSVNGWITKGHIPRTAMRRRIEALALECELTIPE